MLRTANTKVQYHLLAEFAEYSLKHARNSIKFYHNEHSAAYLKQSIWRFSPLYILSKSIPRE